MSEITDTKLIAKLNTPEERAKIINTLESDFKEKNNGEDLHDYGRQELYELLNGFHGKGIGWPPNHYTHFLLSVYVLLLKTGTKALREGIAEISQMEYLENLIRFFAKLENDSDNRYAKWLDCYTLRFAEELSAGDLNEIIANNNIKVDLK